MNKSEDKHRYDHMLMLPHHRSKKYRHMTITERAAQFGAFRALTGYEDAIAETGRLTEKKIELDEYEKEIIDFKLRYIYDRITDMPEISVTYFVPDTKKHGGSYVNHNGVLKKIKYHEKKIIFVDGTEVEVENISAITSDIFKDKNF